MNALVPYNQRPYTFENLAYSLLCGTHSGFPICCIVYYLFDWVNSRSWNTKLRRRLGVGYVPCPRCIAYLTFIEKVNDCTCRYPIYGKLV